MRRIGIARISGILVIFSCIARTGYSDEVAILGTTLQHINDCPFPLLGLPLPCAAELPESVQDATGDTPSAPGIDIRHTAYRGHCSSAVAGDAIGEMVGGYSPENGDLTFSTTATGTDDPPCAICSWSLRDLRSDGELRGLQIFLMLTLYWTVREGAAENWCISSRPWVFWAFWHQCQHGDIGQMRL